MCDDLTALEEEQALSRNGIDRRRFAELGAIGLAALAAPLGAKTKAPPPPTEKMVRITTTVGVMDAFFVHPRTGRYPAVILWPDIAGLREAYKVMARRLAADGFAVLVLNQYYRSAKAPHFAAITQWRTPEGQAKLRPMIPLLTPEAIVLDSRAAAEWLDNQRAVHSGRAMSAAGYCQGGAFAVRSAYAYPARIRAAASFHGASLVTERAESPHRLLQATSARFLFAIARNDDARSPAEKNTLKAAAKDAAREAEVEVYPADHGWCTLDSPVYDKGQADRAWERMLVLFRAASATA
jgi:carboxymethylenebutenolidase